jgi:hypothetical protein
MGATSTDELRAIQEPLKQDQLATLLRLTERYCVVFQTLAGSPALSVTALAG